MGDIGLEHPNVFEHRLCSRRADAPSCRDNGFQTHDRREEGLPARLMVTKIGLVNRERQRETIFPRRRTERSEVE